MTKTIGVIGLGIMGGAMSRNLVKAGFKVVGYDVAPFACESAQAGGVEIVSSAVEVAKLAPVILTSLAVTKAVYATAEAIAAAGVEKRTIIEASTLQLEDKLAAGEILSKAGHTVLDCPMLGTGPHAANRELVVYASGDTEALRGLEPVFSAIGRKVFDMGDYGNGSRMKLVTNHLVAIYNVASAEAMVLGMQAGLDPHRIVEVISAGMSGRVFEFRAPMVAKNQYEPPTMKIDVWQKDMAAIGALGQGVGAPLPVFNSTRAIYDAAQAAGQGGMDVISTARVLERMAGVTR
jgi:putative dehydrogenase